MFLRLWLLVQGVSKHECTVEALEELSSVSSIDEDEQKGDDPDSRDNSGLSNRFM